MTEENKTLGKYICEKLGEDVGDFKEEGSSGEHIIASYHITTKRNIEKSEVMKLIKEFYADTDFEIEEETDTVLQLLDSPGNSYVVVLNVWQDRDLTISILN